MSHQDWVICPKRDHPEDQKLFGGDYAQQTIEIPPTFLVPGIVYIAQHPNGFLSDCRTVGLRVAITVKPNVCASSDSGSHEEDCLGHGECVSTLLEEKYSCQCEGYTGKYCEEYDACYHKPCKNNGSCEDVIEGQIGTSFTCNCTEGFSGKSYCFITLI